MIRTAAGRDLLSWRGNHGSWTEARWIEAIERIEQEAAGSVEERLQAAYEEGWTAAESKYKHDEGI